MEMETMLANKPKQQQGKKKKSQQDNSMVHCSMPDFRLRLTILYNVLFQTHNF